MIGLYFGFYSRPNIYLESSSVLLCQQLNKLSVIVAVYAIYVPSDGKIINTIHLLIDIHMVQSGLY